MWPACTRFTAASNSKNNSITTNTNNTMIIEDENNNKERNEGNKIDRIIVRRCHCRRLLAEPNVRATRLAMSCGCFAFRFRGNVVLYRSFAAGERHAAPLCVEDVWTALCVTPDLRRCVWECLSSFPSSSSSGDNEEETLQKNCNDAVPPPPEWLQDACRSNYQDGSVLSRLAEVMNPDRGGNDDDDDDDENDSGSDSDSSCQKDRCSDSSTNEVRRARRRDGNNGGGVLMDSPLTDRSDEGGIIRPAAFAVATSPLCLHCRRPASTLCAGCGGAYFCDPPRSCLVDGWSHRCLCPTWKLYTQRRKELSTFLLQGWYRDLVGRRFQMSEGPYERFLEELGVVKGCEGDGEDDDSAEEKLTTPSSSSSWWRTEMDGWSGGCSASAKIVHVTVRRSYKEGFYPVGFDRIPPERPAADFCRYADAGISPRKNVLGFAKLRDWDEYYQLRGIPADSPAALLLTYPLTLYHAIVEYGEVPCQVAQMLGRPLRVHIVGAEKELHFLDLFREVAYLLPSYFHLELVFVVRSDMLPPALLSKSPLSSSSRDCNGGTVIEVDLMDDGHGRLHAVVVSGTYGDSLDPNFDCGAGPPDMIVAFNAGLYAYDSWRGVVEFLAARTGVVGVFTDYNEFSGVQCASLGGALARESLTVNPFRQPRAMPVYSMNLPQFSNGFLYVFNQQQVTD